MPSPPDCEEMTEIGRVLELTDEAIASAELELSSAGRMKMALMQTLFTRGLPGRHSHFKEARVFRHNFEIPESWDVAPLRESVSSVEYGTNAPSNEGRRGLPVVAIPEVIASRFRLGACSYAEVPRDEAEALRLSAGDVLLIRTNGNPEYIGKSTVIGEELGQQHIIFASYLIRVRTNDNEAQRPLFELFLGFAAGATPVLSNGKHFGRQPQPWLEGDQALLPSAAAR